MKYHSNTTTTLIEKNNDDVADWMKRKKLDGDCADSDVHINIGWW